jgi:probable F420-dependent oxidoreductase
MKLGLYGINMGVCADPTTAVRVAVAAEAAGFESVWTAEHVVLPEPQPPDSPIPPSVPFIHPAVALAYIAGHTRTLRLATGITILPLHDAVILAKEFASLDFISGGRLIFGLGAGYLPQEFVACGIPFEHRGARTDEGIDVLRDLWTSARPRFEGRFFRYADVDAHPRPVQRPHPPIIVGGMSAPAFRRAVARGNGWYGFGLDLATTEKFLAGLREAARQVERPASLGPLEITVTPSLALDAGTIAQYAAIGVHRLVVRTDATDADSIIDFVEHTGRIIA